MANRRTRRDFLITTAAAGSLAIVLPEELLATKVGAVFVRRNVKFLGPNHPDIVSLKAGIQAMKNLPAANPLNWNRWANIHRHPNGLAGPLFNTCQHGHWWFFPWHRMYILFFERIIRQLSGNPNFSLPYWDYTAGTVAGSLYNAGALPRLFWSPQNNTNPLYNSVRNGGAAAGFNAGAAITPAALSTTVAMNTTTFVGSLRFGGQQVAAPTHFAGGPHGRLEANPHDSVHSAIGGDMGDPGRAARDPIFFLHHCNIDRLWNVWLKQAGRTNPTGNAAWCKQPFQFFNTSGQVITSRVRDVLRAQAQLGYRYEEEPLPQASSVCTTAEGIQEAIPEPSVESRTVVVHQQTITLGAAPTRVNLPMGNRTESLRGIANDTRRNLVLRLEGVKVDRQPGVVYEVYVGLPAGQPAVHTSPHFVGVLATFGVGTHGGHGDSDGVISFPIDRAAAAALTANPTSVPITFVPRGLIVDGREQPVQLQGNVTFTRFRVHEE
ncbi:MAG: polyphenol oxidase [Acidobacteriota bacterium]|nr:polyphenol oxidase [Acidobacteriota bacterium]